MTRLLFIFLLQILIAQSGFQMPGSGIILGEVISSDSGMPVEYASITLVNTKSSEIEMGQLSDQNGIFVFKEVKNGDYFVEIKFMGYETWKSKELNINSSFTKPTRKDLNLIQLKTKVLEGQSVNITDQKEMYEFEADKLVYNPDKDIIAASGSAEDVLNRTPMVTVDQDGEVQLRGLSNVNILVDGRKNRMDLANISGSQIERVEVITSASAKYDPEGMAGIINIVLKKGTTDGFNGNIQMKGQHNQFHSLDEMNGISSYGNYRKGKFNFFSSIGANNRFRNGETTRNRIRDYIGGQKDTTYLDDLNAEIDYIDTLFYDRQDSLFYTSNGETDRSNQNLKFGVDYYYSDLLTLTNEFSIRTQNKIETQTQNYTKPETYSEKTIKDQGDDNYNLEYLFILDKDYKDPDQMFDFSIRLDSESDNETDIQLDNDTGVQQYFATFQDEEFGADIDLAYKQPISETSKLEIGYDGNFANNQNIMTFDGRILGSSILIDTIFSIDGNGVPIIDDIIIDAGTLYLNDIRNQFNFKRDIHAFFLEYETELSSQWSIKPSARIEYIDRNVTFNSSFNPEIPENYDEIRYEESVLDNLIEASNNESYNLNRFEFYPFLNLTYNISKNQNIQFGFGRRVKRPGSGGHGAWELRPFPRNIYNEAFVFVGNPFLKPEYSNQYDINYSRPIPMGFATVNLFYHELFDKTEWYLDTRYDGSVLTFKNVSNAYHTGIGLFSMIMGQTLGGGYALTIQTDTNNPDDYELNEKSERFYIFNRIKFPEKYIKVFDFEFGFYWMKMKLPSGSLFGNKGTAWGDLGISKKFLDKKLTVSFTIDNIFDSGGFQMKRTVPAPSLIGDDNDDNLPDYQYVEEFTEVASIRNGRTIKLTFKYQFGKKTNDKKKGFGRGGDSDGGGMMDMGY